MPFPPTKTAEGSAAPTTRKPRRSHTYKWTLSAMDPRLGKALLLGALRPAASPLIISFPSKKTMVRFNYLLNTYRVCVRRERPEEAGKYDRCHISPKESVNELHLFAKTSEFNDIFDQIEAAPDTTSEAKSLEQELKPSPSAEGEADQFDAYFRNLPSEPHQ